MPQPVVTAVIVTHNSECDLRQLLPRLADPRVQAISGRQGDNGPHYVYARLRPNLPAVEKGEAFKPHAIFLLDTSLSEHPDRFAVSMKLLRKILEGDPAIKRFNILTFNIAAAWIEPKGWIDNTDAGRDRAFAAVSPRIGLSAHRARPMTTATPTSTRSETIAHRAAGR